MDIKMQQKRHKSPGEILFSLSNVIKKTRKQSHNRLQKKKTCAIFTSFFTPFQTPLKKHKENKSMNNDSVLRTKHYPFFLSTLIIGICLIFLQGCSRSSSFKSAIESVLEQDHGTGNTTAAECVRQQDAINLSNCPTDFRLAYIKHKNAWKEAAIVEQEIKNWEEEYDSFGAVVESFFRGLVFDYGMPAEARAAAERIQAHGTQASKEIRDTWAEVLGVAAKYGVDISPYE